MRVLRSVISRLIAKRWRLQIRRWFNRLRGRRSVHVLHVGKTGGTAVRLALATHRRAGRFDLQLQWHDVTLKDIPRGDYVVFFLRDPVSRFASGFDNQRRGATPYYTHVWSEADRAVFDRFKTEAELALALGSGDAETRGAAEAAMREIDHVRTSYWDWFGDEAYFRSRLDDILFVGFQETLSADFDELKRRLGLPDDVALPVDDRRAQRRPTKPEPLPPEAVALLRDWYATDYAFIRLCEETVLDRAAPGDAEPTERTRAR